MDTYFNLKVGDDKVNGVVLQYDGNLTDRTGTYQVRFMRETDSKRLYELCNDEDGSIIVAVDSDGLVKVVECSEKAFIFPLSREEAERRVSDCENWRLMQGWVAPDLPVRSCLEFV